MAPLYEECNCEMTAPNYKDCSMLRHATQILLLLAACAGAMPANTCILMLAGVCRENCCCASNHNASACCDASEEACHDDYCFDGPNSNQPHTACVTISAESVVMRAKHAPVIDFRSDTMPLAFALAVMTASGDAIGESEPMDSLRFLKPPDLPLYLRLHSFLI